MAERAFPLDNTLYYAADMRLFHAGRTGGLVNFTGDDFPIIAVSGTTVTIGAGVGFVKTGEEAGGIVFENEGDLSLRLDPPTATTRYDYIAIQYDGFENSVSLKAVRGGAAMPVPVRTGGVWELILYVVQVRANVSSVSAADVTDTRMDENYCGLTVDTLTKIPTQGFQNQFSGFMESLKDKLGENAAGNLQKQIDELSVRIDEFLSGEGSIDDIRQKLKDVETLAAANQGALADLEHEVENFLSEMNSRPAVRSIGRGLDLDASGMLQTASPLPKVGTSTPTVTSLEEGQIYLQV